MRVLCLALLCSTFQAFGGGIVLDLTKTYVDGNSAPYNTLKPGDTLYVQAGTRSALALKNFRGLPGSPIVVINTGGLAVIENNTLPYAVSLQNCANIKFTGKGKAGITYGFKINAKNGVGLGASNGSTEYELENLEISSGVGPGILAKSDPDCSGQYTREKFTSRRIYIHHNYIHDTGTEGMYIGSTYYEGQTIRCNNRDTVMLPHMSEDVRVYSNRTLRTGWDGIQVSSSRNALIYDNVVEEDSQKLTDFQMNGIILGKGMSGKCYNNLIKNGKGTGLISFAKGPVQIFNNIIKYPGSGNSMPASNYGMYIDAKYSAGTERISILNNLIIGPKTEAIRYLGDAVGVKDTIANNIVVDELKVAVPAKIINVMATEGTAVNNKVVADFSTLNYCDPANDNFRICKKRTISGRATVFLETAAFPDFNGDRRVVGSDMDYGPTEFQEEAPATAIGELQIKQFSVYPNPTASQLSFDISGDQVPDPRVTMELISLNGQLVKSYPLELTSGNNHFTLDMESIPNGIYILRYRSFGEYTFTRFSKL